MMRGQKNIKYITAVDTVAYRTYNNHHHYWLP